MRARLIVIGVLLAISFAAGTAGALALPVFEGAIIARWMVGVLAFFVVFIVLTKVMNAVWLVLGAPPNLAMRVRPPR